ncbi:hypothetical protein [Leptospira alexanderi]|uniref:hypothetical protein n=1 Tax=Leptospira alexanderi TaxID=100053 RepID=UPI0011155445|nr:hypothetical protein [Leptospira alexanderi]
MNQFRIFRENLGSISIPENWKSTYLLVKNNMNEINKDTTEEQALVQSIEKTIKSINHGRNEEFDLLNNQVKELKEQVKNYAEEIEKVKNQNIFFELLNLILRIFGINIK